MGLSSIFETRAAGLALRWMPTIVLSSDKALTMVVAEHGPWHLVARVPFWRGRVAPVSTSYVPRPRTILGWF